MPPAFVDCFDITVILFAFYVQVASWLKSSGRLMLLMLVYVRSLFSLVIAYFDSFVSCTVWARILMMLSAVCMLHVCCIYATCASQLGVAWCLQRLASSTDTLRATR